MGQKPERAPCLSTISCGDGFVAMSCVSMGAQCAATVQQRQSRMEETKQNKKTDSKKLKEVPEAKVNLAKPLDHDLTVTYSCHHAVKPKPSLRSMRRLSAKVSALLA